MRVLNISIRDFAGVSIKFTQALRQNTDYEVRNLSQLTHRYGYPTDIVTRDKTIIRKWIAWADIVNCFGSTRVLYKKPENLVVYYIGSYFRDNPTKVHLVALKMGAKKEVVSGPWSIVRAAEHNLNLEWVPGAIPVDYFYSLKQKNGGLPIVCQSPSSFKTKHTAKIKNALLNKKNMKLQVISDTAWVDCLRLKAKAHIYVGYSIIGYGQSELEAMAMKIPVIAKYPKKSEDAILDHVGYLPYYRCEMKNLPSGIDDLLSDKKTYDEYVERGFNFVRDFHDYPIIAKRISKIYEEILIKG